MGAGAVALALALAGSAYFESRVTRAEVQRVRAETVALTDGVPRMAGASADDESMLLAKLIILSLRTHGERGLSIVPAASPEEQRARGLDLRGRIVSVVGTVGEQRAGDGFVAGRLVLQDGSEAYFVTPLETGGGGRGPREFRGLPIAMRRGASAQPIHVLVGAFVSMHEEL